MCTIASQITSLGVVYSSVYSDADQRKHQSPASLAFVRGIHRGPVNSPHKWPVTRKMFPFDDVIMKTPGRGKAFGVTGLCEKNPLVTAVDSPHKRPATRPFFRRHFQMHFLEWKLLYFDSNFTEVCSLGFKSQWAIIGSDNGLVPTRRQAFIWANGGLVHWRIYASFGLNELTISVNSRGQRYLLSISRIFIF